jgi:photosystem II stability/assembly factor-like uncharacterized protein
MRDEELRRRIGQVADYGERAVSPPDPAVVYRRARRRVARLTAVSLLVALALVGGGLLARSGLPGDERFPAVTVPPGPATTAVPPTTVSPPTTAPATSTTTDPAPAPARYPAAPPMIGDSAGTVLAAQLVTPTSGWALTRTALAWTGDGARSWRTITPRAVPADRVRGAFFLDPRTGWVVASARTRETGSQVQLAVYRTGDAGATWGWSSLGTLDLGGDDAAGGFEGGFGVLAQPSFVDQRNGWVSVQTSSRMYRAHYFLFRTTDGGATWTRLPQPPKVQRAVLSSPTRGWAVVTGRAAATSGQGRGSPGLYTTTDAGRQWRRVGLTPPPSLRGTSVHLREPPTFKTPRDGYLPVEFFARQEGRPRLPAVGFYVTADGGTTWSPRYVPVAEEDEEYGLVALAAAGQRTMLALVGHEARKLLTSRDEGRTWATAATGLEGRYPVVSGLAFADPRTGWAVTGRGTSLDPGCNPRTPRCDDRGVLLRTTDGGTTWTEASPGR